MPLADDGRREQLRERRRDRLEQALLGDEVHIGLDREAGARQQALERGDVVAVEAEAVGELEPARDAALPRRGAVVIDQAAAPFAADFAVGAARDQARILHRDHRLVVIAVERPGLDLALGAFAAMQQMMERMQAMIAPRADVAQLRFEFVGREQCGHSSILIPSSATSKPAASTARRSRGILDQDRIGIVDVNQNAAAGEPCERRQCTIGTSDRHMPHAPPGLRPGAGRDHLVVGKQRAVEQHHVGVAQPLGDGGRELRRAGNEHEALSARRRSRCPTLASVSAASAGLSPSR